MQILKDSYKFTSVIWTDLTEYGSKEQDFSKYAGSSHFS